MKPSKYIYYKKGYKYQTAQEPCHIKLSINPGIEYSCRYYCLTKSGWLSILIGFAWDGASGPTLDTKNSQRGSAAHDALCQMIENGILPKSFRESADQILYDILREDKMAKWRASLWYKVLRKVGGAYSQVRNAQKVFRAP